MILEEMDLEALYDLSGETNDKINDKIDGLIEFLDTILKIEVLTVASGCWSFVSGCAGAQLPFRVWVAHS